MCKHKQEKKNIFFFWTVCITQNVGKQMWWKSHLKYPLFVQVVVQHVNIQGLGRTKEDLLGYEISDVFHARNLIDVRTIGDGEVPASAWNIFGS